MSIDVRKHNASAWDAEVERGNPWTIPVGPERVEAARRGDLEIYLTPTKPVPADWLPPLRGADVLCLASGGGQQGPLLAAAGARTTVFDNSPRQLARDREVAEREALDVLTVEGDMRDLSAFDDESFDLVFHPVSNCFVPDLQPVWNEAWRVLRPWGQLLSAFSNGVVYIFDEQAMEAGELKVTRSLPHSDLESLTAEELDTLVRDGRAIEFGHTLEEQVGGQLNAGFALIGVYEDREPDRPLATHMAMYMATRALKPGETEER